MLGFFVFMAGYGSCLYLVFSYVFLHCVIKVIKQKGAFDCVTDSNWRVEPSSTAKKAAQAAINGWDPSGGAIYYYNPVKTTNKWILSRKVVTVIGSHRFCI